MPICSFLSLGKSKADTVSIFLQNCQTFSIHFLFTLQYSAIIKNKINRILNKENNASNPREFGECIQKQGGISNVTVIMIFDLVKVNN